MRLGAFMLAFLLSSVLVCSGCGGGNGGVKTPEPPTEPSQTVVAMPVVKTAAAQNGAVIVSLSTTTSGATIYYTLDGSTPTTASQIYQAPMLVASSLMVKALATAPGDTNSSVASQAFAPGIASGTLVWSDEFTNSGTTAQGQPNPATWTYDVGTNCCGNNELETYCAWGSTTGPCNPANPNAYVGTDGYLHVEGLNPSANVYTSARLKSSGLFSFMYGRIEARMKLPESQGMWPAFWLLGNNIATINWPACGELDVMEHINGNNSPTYVGGPAPGYDWIAGSVHGGTSGANELNGTQEYHPAGFSAADWHTYGMTWTKGQIQFYVDDPSKPYATFTSTNGSFNASTWPFDAGPQFVILNLAIGGSWPGNPDSTTVFPGNMLVDYVRIYTN
jgi:beta-glucanase (GH16 family)